MNNDSLIGILIIVCGLGFMTYLILWSRKTMQRIARKQLHSLRDILKELHHGR
jgi:Trk-type K+ transport system membrane component